MKKGLLVGIVIGLVIAGVAVVVVLQLPSGGSSSTGGSTPGLAGGVPKGSPPEDVVRHLLACMRTSDYEGLKSCHTPMAWQVVAPMYEGMQSDAMGQRLRERMANVQVSIKHTDVSADRATVLVQIRDGDESTDETFSLVKTDEGWRVDYVPAPEGHQRAARGPGDKGQGLHTQEAIARLAFEAMKKNNVDILLAHRLGKSDTAWLMSRFDDTERARRMSRDEWREFEARFRQQAAELAEKIRRDFSRVRERAESDGVDWTSAQYVRFNYRPYRSTTQGAGPQGGHIDMVFRSKGQDFSVKLDCLKLTRGWVLHDDIGWNGRRWR